MENDSINFGSAHDIIKHTFAEKWPSDVLDKYYRERVLRDEIFEVRRNDKIVGLCVVERRAATVLHLRYAFSASRESTLELASLLYQRYDKTPIQVVTFMRRDRHVIHSARLFHKKIVTLTK